MLEIYVIIYNIKSKGGITLKKKSVFGGILLLILIILACLVTTVSVALLAGAADVNLFDFSHLNFSNMIPILIVGGILSCFIIGIAFLFLGRTIFFKVKDYFFETDNKDRSNEK